MAVQIRALVVDDSALMRKLIPDLLESDSHIEVVDTARDGVEAVDKTIRLRPDVVVMDIQMPRMSGLEALDHIMSRCPVPVVVLTGLTDPSLAIEALEKGAVDFVLKPSGPISVDIYKVRQELIEKVRLAALANIRKNAWWAGPLVFPPASFVTTSGDGWTGPSRGRAVAIGASTGGPKALEYILGSLPTNLPAPLLVVQHMPPGFTRSFARRLNERSRLMVKEAKDGDFVLPGWVYLAPGGYHMLVERRGGREIIRLDRSPPVKGLRPSADMTMCSVAEVYEAGSIGVILTGMGSDGVEGLKAIKMRGGVTIAQDEATSIIYGMPRVAARSGWVDRVLPLDRIPGSIELVLAEERS